MTEDIFSRLDPEELRENAVQHLEQVTNDLTNGVITNTSFYLAARNIWDNINRNPVLHQKLEALNRWYIENINSAYSI